MEQKAVDREATNNAKVEGYGIGGRGNPSVAEKGVIVKIFGDPDEGLKWLKEQ